MSYTFKDLSDSECNPKRSMPRLITLFYQMPKLKKHSRIQTEIYEDSKQPRQVETEVEDASIAFDFQNPKGMKHSDRVKILKQPKQKKDPSVVPSDPSSEQPFTLVCDGEMDKFMNKFTDDDEDISIIENNIKPRRRKCTKEPRKEIKTKNKMFSNLDFKREEVEQQRQESIQKLQILIEKKEKRETHNLEKFQKKAQVFKNKLDYKDLNKDGRYKRKIQDNLKSIQDGDELDIVVEVPKIFAGNTQVEAALFLKNSKKESCHVQLSDYVHSQLEEDENSIPKDRKLYFAELQRQMKIKKAEQFTQSSLKECFKKSLLDDKDYIPNFDDRDRQGNYQEFLESQKSKPQNICHNQEKRICLDTSVSNREGEESFKKCYDVQWEVPQNKANSSLETSHPQEFQNEEHKKNQIFFINVDDSSKPSKLVENPKKIPRQKPSRKANKSKKRSNFAFKDLIEVEAELSEDEDQHRRHRDDEEESQSDDDNDLQSLIDNDVDLNSHDRHALHRKYVQDSMEEEERKFEEMRKKMQKNYLEEDERLNKRMKEAARKNYIRQNKEDKEQKTENRIQQLDQGDSTSYPSSSVTAEKQKNQLKFKELEQQLARDTKTERQLALGKGVSKLGKLEQIQSGIMNTQKNGLKKTNRNGLKNIQVRGKSVKTFRPSK